MASDEAADAFLAQGRHLREVFMCGAVNVTAQAERDYAWAVAAAAMRDHARDRGRGVTPERERAIRAEAWDEGLDAGRARWADFREFGESPVNPYREDDPC